MEECASPILAVESPTLSSMNPLHFLQSKFLQDEEKIMKSISKPTFKNITRYKYYSQIEYIKKEKNMILQYM